MSLGAFFSFFPTGLAGGHIIIPDDIYHGIRTVLRSTFGDWGLKYTEIDTSDLEQVQKALASNLHLLYLLLLPLLSLLPLLLCYILLLLIKHSVHTTAMMHGSPCAL